MKITAVIATVTCLALSSVSGSVELLLGIEGPAREPEFNKTQEWMGLQYTHEKPVFESFRIFAKGLVGTNSSEEYLLVAGLSYVWYPSDSIEDLGIRIQTGPSYTKVGWPHTGSELNWTTDLTFEYRGFLIGYSHTSNAGFSQPNSGLDMILLGYSVRWE